MDWTLWITVVAVIVAFFALKRLSYVSAETARKLRAEGALVIDVRSPEEFRQGQVPGAINIPLGELGESLPRRVPDRSQALLLHCLSGTRSGVAKRQLQGMGYTNVFNLGSFGRARRIVQGNLGARVSRQDHE
jgi:phage shock protein E